MPSCRFKEDRLISFLDISIFMFLTAFSFIGMLFISLVKQPNETKVQLQRHPLKVKITKKSGIQDATGKFDRWFIRLLRRANIRVDRMTILLLIVCSGLTASAVAFVAELPLAVTIAAGFGIVMLGFGFYYMLMLRRIQSFNKQFPAGLELMARATRAGESLEHAFGVAGRASEQPLRSEFGYCQRQLNLGLPIKEVVADLADRIGSADLKLFAHTVAIHRSIGGRLASALESLSVVVRQRAECNEKLKSMTGLGRFAVIAIVALGGLGLTYMVLMEPEYIGRLTQSELGNQLIVYAVVSELIGLAWVGWSLNSEV